MLTVEFILYRILEVLLSPLSVYVGHFDGEWRVEEHGYLWYLSCLHEVRYLVQHQLRPLYVIRRYQYRTSACDGFLKGFPHLVHSSLLGILPVTIYALHDKDISVLYGFWIR